MSMLFRILTLPVCVPGMFLGYLAGQIKSAAVAGWNAAD